MSRRHSCRKGHCLQTSVLVVCQYRPVFVQTGKAEIQTSSAFSLHCCHGVLRREATHGYLCSFFFRTTTAAAHTAPAAAQGSTGMVLSSVLGTESFTPWFSTGADVLSPSSSLSLSSLLLLPSFPAPGTLYCPSTKANRLKEDALKVISPITVA